MQHLRATVIISSKVFSLSDELITSFLTISSLTVSSANAFAPSRAAIVKAQQPPSQLLRFLLLPVLQIFLYLAHKTDQRVNTGPAMIGICFLISNAHSTEINRSQFGTEGRVSPLFKVLIAAESVPAPVAQIMSPNLTDSDNPPQLPTRISV